MTATELTIDDVHAGWEDVSAPDDLVIILKTSCTRHWMTASLRELLQLYYYAINEEGCYLGVGTGKSIEIDPQEDHVRLKKPPLDIVTTFENIRAEVEGVIAQTMVEKDIKSDPKTRTEALDYLQQFLDEHEQGLDVRELYERLSSN